MRRQPARPWFWLAAATALVSLPILFVGFSYDDFAHRLVLEHRIPGYAGGWFGLYDFTPPNLPAPALIDGGLLPWFTSPELSLRFLRPLSSATLALDHVLFGRNAFWAHAHSMLWMGLLTWVTARLFLRWFSARAAWFSAFVFALSGVHGVPTAWLASRHTTVAAALGALALWAWARYREQQWRAGFWFALGGLVASLLASESGLVAVVFLVGYELGTRGLRRGLAGAAPHLLVGLGYLALYGALGYGAKGSSFYVSPFDSPGRYLLAASTGIPTLSVELLTGFPSALGAIFPAARLPFVFLGLVLSSGAAWLLYALRSELTTGERRTLLWLAPATLVSLGALVGAVVTGRVLPLPMLGAAAVLGNLLSALWGRARPAGLSPDGARPGPRGSDSPRWQKRWLIAFGAMALFEFGISPLSRVGSALQYIDYVRLQRQLALDADVGSCANGGQLYLLTAADPTLVLSAAAALLFYTPEKAGAEHFRSLSMAPQAQRLTRVTPNAFELEVLDLPRQSNAFEHLYRPTSDPLRAGQQIQLTELNVLTREVSSGVFTRAHFETRADLEAMNVCLLVWRGGKLAHLPWPALGESVRIEHEPGPMGM